MPSKKRRLLVSVHFLLVSASLGVLLVIGGLAATIGARGVNDALRAASEEQFATLGLMMQEKARRLIDPVQSQLGILIYDPLTEARDIITRLSRLPILHAVLRDNTTIRSVYIGYPNGEFMLVRKIDQDALRERFRAPNGTSFLVQSLTLNVDGDFIGAFRYYDFDLTLLDSRLAPDYHFDPRTRTWYAASSKTTRPVTSEPYAFFTTGDVGITISQRAANAGAILGLDATVASLAKEIGDMRITDNTKVAVVQQNGTLIAYSDFDKTLGYTADGRIRRNNLSSINVPILRDIETEHGLETEVSSEVMNSDGEDWIFAIRTLDVDASETVRIVFAVPTDELFAATRSIIRSQVGIIVIVLLIFLPVGLYIIRQIARPLSQLSEDVKELASFEFGNPVFVKTRIKEAVELAGTVDSLRVTIRRFLDINRAIAAEEDFDTLLVKLLDEIIATTKTEAGILYLVSDREDALRPYASRLSTGRNIDYKIPSVPLTEKNCLLVRSAHDEHAEGAPANDLELERMGLAGIQETMQETPHNLLAAPLFNRAKELVGVILLMESETVDPALIKFTEALSGSAAVTVEARRLIAAQKELFESFIQLIAGAIDAKSPYTGGHCARVPELTKMLAQAAEKATDGPMRDFHLTRDDWEAIHVASWLHDCGKVTTPEFVVDKATKLETIYDRIHEIRMRVEVMKREAEIRRLRNALAIAGVAIDEAALAQELATMDADFAFLAETNVGGEFMSDEHLARIEELARKTWTRTLDDRIGISHEERERKDRTPASILPVQEPLLADRDEHKFDRPESERIDDDNIWGFRMEVPDLLYDRGEIHNLTVRRGTLTDEDRYKINEHIVQTIKMLDKLPFPKHLRNVPELAGGHHEKMDGTGYPKRLAKQDMSPVARMMAIADIFEALTAVDRPYKKGKTLSEALKIMTFMVKDQHVDADLFDIFLTSGIYLDYAKKYMQPQQIDDVDPQQFRPVTPV
ncbi:hypothetical protein HH303_03740 [Rhodospirillaceae bacterium KN72]|uniref:Uncharacterized protein n=1 Tax=Pacificispira spongiicola TaxID=2729598 RepID=A0A7Y0DZ96_9PROT|nr:HD domain-containing phosphohydrolase [Pacificispira spongiicola]NMM43576.1 hypothetical protein [Pacificispira spongiicola]